MTHIAWVPQELARAARGDARGAGRAHPSRTILLVPEPDAGATAIDASVYRVECFDLRSETDHVCTEVVELHLRGDRAEAPASIVEPLLISDLPVFLRWRGSPPWRSPRARADRARRRPADRRLDRVGRPARRLRGARRGSSTGRAVSDIAWAARSAGAPCSRRCGRESPTSRRSASRAPPRRRSCSPAGCARGSAGRSRSSTSRPSGSGRSRSTASRRRPARRPADPSELLSDELERFSRDPIYEAAVAATCASPKPTTLKVGFVDHELRRRPTSPSAARRSAATSRSRGRGSTTCPGVSGSTYEVGASGRRALPPGSGLNG